MTERCPRCGSDDLRGAKFGFGDVGLYERACRACGLAEFRRTTDDDFDEWFDRWSPGNEAVIVDAASPWDDAARLAYADSVQASRPERAELIRLQIARFLDERARGVEIGRPSARETELLERYGDEWARHIAHLARPYLPDVEYRGYRFERGFVAQIRTDPDILSDPDSGLFELAPIEHLDLTTRGALRKALVSPQLARLRSLSLNEVGLTDDDVCALATEGHLDRLEWLDLCLNPFTRTGVEVLVASPAIRRIPIVLLGSHPYNPGMEFDADFHGRVSESWMPEYGQMLEEQHGRIGWLHLPHFMHRPDRYHARAVRYVD